MEIAGSKTGVNLETCLGEIILRNSVGGRAPSPGIPVLYFFWGTQVALLSLVENWESLKQAFGYQKTISSTSGRSLGLKNEVTFFGDFLRLTRSFIDKGSHKGYLCFMKSVGIKQLKNNLSRYLRLVQEGEWIFVTDRDEVVAEIHKPTHAVLPQMSKWVAFLNEEERKGALIRSKGGKSQVLTDIKVERIWPKKLDLDSMLMEIKSERF